MGRKAAGNAHLKGSNKHAQMLKDDPEYRAWWEARVASSQNPGFTGKTHSEETKRRMCDTRRGQSTGPMNSQFGTCWIYNTNQQRPKKIKLCELDSYICDGWTKGRKSKF